MSQEEEQGEYATMSEADIEELKKNPELAKIIANAKSIFPDDGSGCKKCDKAAIEMFRNEICSGLPGEEICIVEGLKILKKYKDKDITEREFLQQLQNLTDKHEGTTSKPIPDDTKLSNTSMDELDTEDEQEVEPSQKKQENHQEE